MLTAAPSDLPADWPHRAASRTLAIGPVRWHLQRTGTGPTVLLLHGTAGATHTWAAVIDRLQQHCDCLAIDLPGHGFTRGAGDALMSLDAMTAAIREVLTALDVSPKIGVGHSAGVAVLLSLHAHAAPVMSDAIIGANSALVPPLAFMQNLLQPVTREVFALSPVTTLAAAVLGRGGLARRLLQTTGTQLPAAQEARYVDMLSDPDRVRAAMQMMARWDLPALQQLLPAVRCPVTLLHSRAEPWVPWHDLDQATRALPRRTLVDVPGAGHLLPEERPDVVVDAVLSALPAARTPAVR